MLLGARSFTDLLNRYRCLQQIASSDRRLVERVGALEAELAEQNEQLRERMALLGTLRQDRVSEVAELRQAGLTFRNDAVTGPGGTQILLQDPSGNLIELFQPAGS